MPTTIASGTSSVNSNAGRSRRNSRLRACHTASSRRIMAMALGPDRAVSCAQILARELKEQVLEVRRTDPEVRKRYVRVHERTQRAIEIVGRDLDPIGRLEYLERQRPR